MSIKKRGRPTSYDADMLGRAVTAAEAEHGDPSPAQVKTELRKIAGSVPNDAVFERNLQAFYASRQRDIENRLIGALPEEVGERVQSATESLRRQTLLVIAETHEAIRKGFETKNAERETRSQALVYRVNELEAELESKNAEITGLRDEIAEQSDLIEGLNREKAELERKLGEAGAIDVLADRVIERLLDSGGAAGAEFVRADLDPKSPS
ncbi:MAG: hypothetical protein ACP5EN_12685 [Rhodovulum sp.]